MSDIKRQKCAWHYYAEKRQCDQDGEYGRPDHTDKGVAAARWCKEHKAPEDEYIPLEEVIETFTT